MEEKDYSKYTVLVVDDIPVNILLIKGMLADMKFNVLSANSGRAALDIVARQKPDVILMDVLMPEMNGYACTHQLKTNPATRDIPVIIVSALSSDADMKEGLAVGANDFVTKPIIKERLINCILNQLRLAETKRGQNSAMPDDKQLRDGFTSLLAYMACTEESHRLNTIHLFSVGVPMGMFAAGLAREMVRTLRGVSDDTVDDVLLALLAKHIGDQPLVSKSIPVRQCIGDAVDKFAPLLDEKKISVAFSIDEQMTIATDPEMFWAIVINIIVCASRATACARLSVEAQYDEGLLTIVVRGRCDTKAQIANGLNVRMAQRMAEHMGGTMIAEQNGEDTFFVQLIIPLT